MKKNSRRLRVIIVCQVILGLLIFSGLFAQNVAGVSIMPAVTITLNEASVSANVGPGDMGEAIFTGVVVVDCLPGETVIVSLYAEDTWETALVDPASLTFRRSGEQSFTVNVRAPLGISCMECGTVTVTGRWSMYPGSITGPTNPREGAVGRIEIEQYHEYTVKCQKFIEQISPSQEVQFDLTIENNGNGLESFSLEIGNIDELSKNGLYLSINPSKLKIEVDEIDYATVFVRTASGGCDAGYHDINIEVISEKGSQKGIPPEVCIVTVESPVSTSRPPPEEPPEVEEPEPIEEPEQKEPPEEFVEEEYVADVSQANDNEFLNSREFFYLLFILAIMLITAVALIAIGALGNRRDRIRARALRRRRY